MTRPLFPKITPFKEQLLPVGGGHSLYVEQSGNPNGIPAIYLHGGPGAGCNQHHRRYFDPNHYHVICFDQRGCGRSNPSPSIQDVDINTYIEDIESIRKHLNLDQCLLVGGAWGASLALVYATKYTHHVLGLILRSASFLNEDNYLWRYGKSGVARFFPDHYASFTADVDNEASLFESYYQVLSSENELAKVAASKSWYQWELRLASVEHQNNMKFNEPDRHQALCMAQLACHFAHHKAFLPKDYIQNNLKKIQHLTAMFIHGRFDLVNPIENAFAITDNWQNASLHILPQAGHSGFETQTIDAICKATDLMAKFLESDNT